MTTAIYEEICQYVRGLIKDTQWEGHVFAVGGCCRDEIMGRDIKDVDLAVDIPGGGVDFARWLHHRKLTVSRPIYFEKYGTAKLVLRRFPDDEIEVVQTRAEKYTKATSRCPEVVAGSITDDCFRRDFTVNTLYRDITRGDMLDLTGHGIDDIRAGILRTPTDPNITFDDDPVRILRCIRFAARFGWKIDPDTFDALLRNIPRLEIVSRERNRSELGKMLAGNNPVAAMEMLKSTGAIGYVMPLLRDFSQDKELWDNALTTVGRIESHDVPLRLAAFFHDAGKLKTRAVNKKGVVSYTGHDIIGADMVRKALRATKFEPSVYLETAILIRLHHTMEEFGENAEDMTDRRLRELQRDCESFDTLKRLAVLSDAIEGFDCPSYRSQRIITRSQEMIDEGSDMFRKTDAADDRSDAPRKSRRSSRRRPGGRRRRPRNRSSQSSKS